MRERDWIKSNVAEWDEFGQGYDREGKLVVCVCGEVQRSGNWSGHYCPYDEPVDLMAAPATEDSR